MLQKVVLKVELNEDRIKQKAMKTVSGISGIQKLIANPNLCHFVFVFQKWKTHLYQIEIGFTQ